MKLDGTGIDGHYPIMDMIQLSRKSIHTCTNFICSLRLIISRRAQSSPSSGFAAGSTLSYWAAHDDSCSTGTDDNTLHFRSTSIAYSNNLQLLRILTSIINHTMWTLIKIDFMFFWIWTTFMFNREIQNKFSNIVFEFETLLLTTKPFRNHDTLT